MEKNRVSVTTSPEAERTPEVRAAARRYVVQGPSLRDPRLHLSLVIIGIHLVGQLYLGFQVSIAQILLCIGTCAIVELLMVAHRDQRLVWPGGALQTGNSIALILRVNGTEHGDWWSLHGWYVFVLAGLLAMFVKQAVRVRDQAVFNPSNIGIVACLLILGQELVSPLPYWWGAWSAPVAAAYAVIALGALWVVRKAGMLPLALAFWGTFAVSLALVASTGHCMTADWSVNPVCGGSFWLILVTSPELLVFTFFMITDPKSTPRAHRSRLLFGASVGVVAALLIAPTTTEFWAKTALLLGLTVVCVGRFLLAVQLSRIGELARLRPAVVPVGLAAVAAGLLLAAIPGGNVPATATTGGVPRPAVSTVDLPAVDLDSAVERIAGGIDGERAQAMGRHLAEALAIEQKAYDEAQPQLLRAALAGPRLEQADAALGTGAAAPETVTFSSLRAVLVRDPSNPKAPPRFGLHASGHRGDTAMETVYEMVLAGGHYLVLDELTPAEAGLDE